MQKLFLFALLAVGSTAVLSGCAKDPLNDMTEEESRIYITSRDSVANFGSYKTFSIVDSVSLIDNNRYAGSESTAWDRSFVAAFREAMVARGYTQVARTQNPDLGVNVSRVSNTSTNLVDLTGYWGGYGGFYDPFYWGYGGYGYNFPPAYGYYQSTEALLSVDILDLKNASSSQTIKGVWNGLIRGSGIFRSSNVQSGVQALFAQSPYIQTTR